MTTDYVLCCTRYQGYIEATVAWGWDKAPGPMGVLSPDGNPVKLVSSAKALADIPVGATLYLAPRHQFAYEEAGGPRVKDIIARHEANGGKVVRKVSRKPVDT